MLGLENEKTKTLLEEDGVHSLQLYRCSLKEKQNHKKRETQEMKHLTTAGRKSCGLLYK